MDRTQLQLQLSASSVPQPRRFVYRAAAQNDALQHPLRRMTDATQVPTAPRALFAEPTAHAVLLQFRVAVQLN